jgi:hypothetical protein
LNENAFDEPMCGLPRRLHNTRSIAFASVAVPDRRAGVRAHALLVDDDRGGQPLSTSTSGRASDGMKPCTKALYVSLIIRCDSAAIVPKTSDDLPEPDTPVNTVSRRFGISTLTSLRLFCRAPYADEVVAVGGVLHDADRAGQHEAEPCHQTHGAERDPERARQLAHRRDALRELVDLEDLVDAACDAEPRQRDL